MNNALSVTIKAIDELISRMHLFFFKEKSSLMTFLFHGLFNDKNEIKLNAVDPQQAITTDIFRQFIEYYLERDYSFIYPQDILNGLENEKKYILITFDDGYYNNHLALPILQEYQVPSVFFISANHIAENKCFWWDIIYRERIKRGTLLEQITKEYEALKKKKNEEIEAFIIDTFGKKALCPIGDIDRPFTPSELNSFSKEQFVSLGNHTSNHAILTNYNPTEIKAEIKNAQDAIFSFTGITPIIISYPNGNFSKEVLNISKELGLKLGITVIEQKNYLPINIQGIDAFLLRRFILWGDKNIAKQCAVFRSDIYLFNTVKKIVKGKSNENSMSY